MVRRGGGRIEIPAPGISFFTFGMKSKLGPVVGLDKRRQ